MHLQEEIQGLLRGTEASNGFKPRESAVCAGRPSTVNGGGVCDHLNQSGFDGFVWE